MKNSCSKLLHVLVLIGAAISSACQEVKPSTGTAMNPEYTVHLSPWEYRVLVEKATDPPGDGGYTNHFEEGTYHCRACGAALYRSSAKFHSGCGWPAFDQEIPGAVIRKPDFSYGMIRTEILCANCGGHLGHVFEGEGFTPTNTRHCVNSSSLIFHPADKQQFIIGVPDFHTCQEIAARLPGVLTVECGFADDGSRLREALRIEYHPRQTTLATIVGALVDSGKKLHGYQTGWCLFTSQRSFDNLDLPAGVETALLERYSRAPEEHQWFRRKAMRPAASSR